MYSLKYQRKLRLGWLAEHTAGLAQYIQPDWAMVDDGGVNLVSARIVTHNNGIGL